jgi:betaine-aldehyde dehydrogenase
MSAIVDQATELDRMHFFVNNEWVAPKGPDTHRALEAATGELLGTAALGSADDIDGAVRAAREALDHGPWGRTTPAERVAVMHRFADALLARASFTSTLVSRENGMPIGLSTALNGEAPAGLLRMYADMATSTDFEKVQPSAIGSTIVRREPVGVVGLITPWNYPQGIALLNIAPALAAGCTVVLKPSLETSLDSYVIGEAAKEAGLPPGVLNIVLADREAGAALVSHPGVDKIAFTGSTASGRTIGAECGRLVRRMTLELGGKSAAILLDDVDIDTFLAGVGAASFMNNAQTCTAQTRILAPRSRYDEIVSALADWCADQTVGDPLDRSVTIGPMASERQQDRVLGYIDIARNSDARLVCGGGRPEGLDRGWFVAPTVFADVKNSDRLATEEVFGPVMAVIPFDGDDEAVRIANDSEYGLAGSVWTADESRGIDIARRIRTGTIGINYYSMDLGAPFGGMKNSGVGRALGADGLNGYFEYKSIYASSALLND